MQAHIGDRLILDGNDGGPARTGEILEIRGALGQSPFIVRWSDDDDVALVFPGPGATIEHLGAACADPAVGAPRG